jgi:hypothetical protein
VKKSAGFPKEFTGGPAPQEGFTVSQVGLRLPARRSIAVAALVTAAAMTSAPAHAETRAYRPAEVHRHTVLFELHGLRASTVRRARVAIVRHRFRVSLRAVRRSHVRFRVPARLVSKRHRARLVVSVRAARVNPKKPPKPTPMPTPTATPTSTPAPAPAATPTSTPAPAPAATPAPTATATPAPAATPAPTATPAPSATPAPGTTPAPITAWRPAGSAPLSDADAAARVTPARETIAANAAANAYRPSAGELDAFRNGQKDKYGRTAVMYNPLTARVTGGFSGTTDEILQWAAHKWGIPEDVVRAVAVNESGWKMSQLGDRKTVANPLLYPAQSRIAGTSDVYQSLGVTQIKWTPEGLHPGTEPLRWKSTAFSADYWGSVIRYYFNGVCDWCGTGYSAGQDWASIGAWYNPSPWGTSTDYVQHVQTWMAQRTWAGFGL